MDDLEIETKNTLQNPNTEQDLPASKVEEDIKRIELGKATPRVVLTEWASRLAKAERDARIDNLTGLFNRQTFMGALERAVSVSRRLNIDLGLLFADVDGYKEVNDKYGHEVGDEVLRKIGQAIRESVREGDHPARYGGEEFGILLPGATSEDVEKVAERIRGAVGGIRLENNPDLTVTVSIGATNLSGEENAEVLLKRTDLAMYEAKRKGKNNVTYEGKTENG
ncbi:MAG: GGDEF domain-containing protein [Candidatus Curtissbacteria bacterium]|nr:GGDEF domain-containing protein [bacterium]MDZ4209854.1 GGDEF domain-containing protein [Candidatus Curtissbacteria bacterium]